MTVDQSSIQLRYPELIDFTDSIQTAALAIVITDADLDVSISSYGVQRDRVQSLLIAHRVTMQAEGGGSPFPVSAVTAAGVATTFAIPADVTASQAELLGSVYGAEYLGLMRRFVGGPRLV